MLNADVSKLAVTEYASLRAINLCVPVRKRVGAGELTAETRASITVFAGWLEKEGYLESRYPNNLKTLVYLGADLKDPEDVKSKLGAHKIKNGAKLQYVYAYDAYCKMNGWTWNRPRYTQEETIPFIPDEGELDQLIAAARSKRMAAYLQTLKETFADPGEALRIEWIDISGNIITINHPVKGHRPRALEVSNKLLAMLNSLPHITERIFPCRYASLIDAYVDLRRRVAETTKNERLLAVEFRTFRHWGGTMIAQMTNGNVLIVMKLLGHKRVENSMKYINVYLLNFKQTEFEVASATTVEDAKPLIAAGFEFVLEKSGIMLFKRAKRFSPVANPISKRETDLVNLK
jgi:integrase